MTRRTARARTVKALVVFGAIAIAATLMPATAAAQGTTVATETGGTGNYYQLIDTNDGSSTERIDVCASGPFTSLFPNGTHQDDSAIEYVTPFPIEFFGSSYATVVIGVNGLIRLGHGSTTQDLHNFSLDESFVQRGIYVWWDDLEFDDTDGSHNLMVCTEGSSPNREFKVLWNNVDCPSDCDTTSGDTVTFGVRFHESDGSFDFVYDDTFFKTGLLLNHAGLATIGIKGFAGDEFLEYSHLEDSILSTQWDVRFYPAMCGDTPATLAATRAGDPVVGTPGDDVIAGHTGDDDIRGEAGDDLICGDGGADKLNGGPDDDTIYGGGGEDEIDGRGGADIIYGGPGGDTISGDGGTDTIYGEGADDTIDGRGAADDIDGGAGDDTIAGHEGADTMLGSGGLDTITGNTGPDTIRGGGEDDTLRGGEGNDIIYGGGGTDLCSGNTGPNDQAQAASCESAPGIETLF